MLQLLQINPPLIKLHIKMSLLYNTLHQIKLQASQVHSYPWQRSKDEKYPSSMVLKAVDRGSN